MEKSKNYAMTEEMISNIKLHISPLYIFVKKSGDKGGEQVGSFIIENCGMFHPVRMLFHLNFNFTPSTDESGFIREVVYINPKSSKGYKEAVLELSERLSPLFKTLYGVRLNPTLNLTDIFDVVKNMGCWVIQAL